MPKPYDVIVTIKKVVDRIRVSWYDSSGVEKGTATNPVYTTGTGSGGAIAANVDNTGNTIGLSTLAKQDLQLAQETAINGHVHDIDSNTDGLANSAGGGYVRQDSTGTIAKETGGNLASCATDIGLIKSTDGIKKITDPVAVTTVKPDGSNTMPSLDTAARAGFMKTTDGTHTLDVTESGDSINNGLAVYGLRASTTKHLGIPVALAADSDANIGASFVPVTIVRNVSGTNYVMPPGDDPTRPIFTSGTFTGTVSGVVEQGDAGSEAWPVLNMNSLVPVAFDNITAVYDVDNNPTSVVYKLAAATVATVTITYDGSGNPLTMVKS